MSESEENSTLPKRALDPVQESSSLASFGSGDDVGTTPASDGSRFSESAEVDFAAPLSLQPAPVQGENPYLEGSSLDYPQSAGAASGAVPSDQGQQYYVPSEAASPVGMIYAPPAKPISLPVVATRYPLFWRSPAWRWWKSILALVVAGVLGFLAMAFIPVIAMVIDLASGRLTMEDMEAMVDGTLKVTPNIFLFNNIGIALGIPLAFLVGAFFRQRPGFMSSIIGKFRWKWFLLVTLVLLPVWLGILAIELIPAMGAGEFAFESNDDTVFLIFAILLTTPFQCAGEEYLDRGVINRGVASFWNNRIGGPLLGAVASSVVFMLMHSADDTFLNIFYFCFGMIACWLTWRTGGLEAAIAVHMVNNMTSMITLPFSDISEMFDRAEGAADLATLGVSMIGPVLAVIIVEFLYRWRRPVAKAAPGLDQIPTPDVLTGRAVLDPYQLPLPTSFSGIPAFPNIVTLRLGHGEDLGQLSRQTAGFDEEQVDLGQLPPPVF